MKKTSQKTGGCKAAKLTIKVSPQNLLLLQAIAAGEETPEAVASIIVRYRCRDILTNTFNICGGDRAWLKEAGL